MPDPQWGAVAIVALGAVGFLVNLVAALVGLSRSLSKKAEPKIHEWRAETDARIEALETKLAGMKAACKPGRRPCEDSDDDDDQDR